MTQPEILFNREFYKLICIDRSANILLHVFRVHHDNLDKDFIAYNTSYEGKNVKILFHKLPQTELLCLIFFSKTGDLFTTLIPYTPQREQHYKKMVGKWFKVNVKGESHESRD